MLDQTIFVVNGKNSDPFFLNKMLLSKNWFGSCSPYMTPYLIIADLEFQNSYTLCDT
jgi:hypothetical protein